MAEIPADVRARITDRSYDEAEAAREYFPEHICQLAHALAYQDAKDGWDSGDVFEREQHYLRRFARAVNEQQIPFLKKEKAPPASVEAIAAILDCLYDLANDHNPVEIGDLIRIYYDFEKPPCNLPSLLKTLENEGFVRLHAASAEMTAAMLDRARIGIERKIYCPDRDIFIERNGQICTHVEPIHQKGNASDKRVIDFGLHESRCNLVNAVKALAPGLENKIPIAVLQQHVDLDHDVLADLVNKGVLCWHMAEPTAADYADCMERFEGIAFVGIGPS